MSLQTTTKPQHIGEWPSQAKAIAMAAAEESDNRRALRCLHVTQHYIEATDGKVLVRCYHQPMAEATELLLPKPDVEIIQLLDERLGNGYLVQLGEGTFGFATAHEEEGHGNEVTVRYTANSLPDRYPDTEMVVPTGRPIAQVEIGVSVLRMLAAILQEACDQDICEESVVLSIYGDEKPIRFFLLNPYQTSVGGEIEGIIMPKKSNDVSKRLIGNVVQARVRAGLEEKR
jgi:hypothetical protein